MSCILQEKLLTSTYSPVLTTKAVKDETEQKILKDAHVCYRHRCLYSWRSWTHWTLLRLSHEAVVLPGTHESAVRVWATVGGRLWIGFIEISNTWVNTGSVMHVLDVWTGLQLDVEDARCCDGCRRSDRAPVCGCVQVRDAVAVMQLLIWLEKTVPQGTETELTAAAYVNARRRWGRQRKEQEQKHSSSTSLVCYKYYL